MEWNLDHEGHDDLVHSGCSGSGPCFGDMMESRGHGAVDYGYQREVDLGCGRGSLGLLTEHLWTLSFQNGLDPCLS